MSFGGTGLISYVAIAGISIKGTGGGGSSITLSNGGLIVDTVFLTRDNVVVFNFV